VALTCSGDTSHVSIYFSDEKRQNKHWYCINNSRNKEKINHIHFPLNTKISKWNILFALKSNHKAPNQIKKKKILVGTGKLWVGIMKSNNFGFIVLYQCLVIAFGFFSACAAGKRSD
jgi:hypothetical protein